MVKHDIIIYEQETGRTLLNIREVSRFVNLHPEMIRKFFMLGLIDPYIEKPQPLFEDSVLQRIEKIVRLKKDLGINLSGCGVVLDLLDRIAELEKQIEYYEIEFHMKKL